MKSIKRALATTAIVALGVAGIAGYGSMSKAADKFKVGWIYLGPVTDGGWNSAIMPDSRRSKRNSATRSRP